MFGTLKGLFAGSSRTFEPGDAPQPLGSGVRIAPCARPVCLDLGERRILLRCDPTDGASDPVGQRCWRIEDAEPGAAVPRGFVRLHPGHSTRIGREDDRARALFDLPRTLPRRHLELRNDGGTLVLKNLAPDYGCTLSLAGAASAGESSWTRRLDALRRLRGLLGASFEMLPPQAALASAEEVVALLGNEPHRPKDAAGRSGGMLELPAGPTPFILGDLHGALDNLLRVLCEDGHLDALTRGEAYLLLLGDTVHRETLGELEEMESSLLMLDFLCRLKLEFPASVFWLRGNHESFDERVGKGGVPQGMLLRRAARQHRGEDYALALDRLFAGLAYLARSDHFIACHAGAPRIKASRDALVAIHDHPDLAEELVWVRPQRRGRPGGFGKRDVVRLRASLGASSETPLIVGHTPQSADGVLWTDIGEIPGCHVVYDARTGGVPVFTRLRGEMIALEYEPERLIDFAEPARCGVAARGDAGGHHVTAGSSPPASSGSS